MFGSREEDGEGATSRDGTNEDDVSLRSLGTWLLMICKGRGVFSKTEQDTEVVRVVRLKVESRYARWLCEMCRNTSTPRRTLRGRSGRRLERVGDNGNAVTRTNGSDLENSLEGEFASTTTQRWDEENDDEAWDEERMGLATLVGYVACVGTREGWIADCMLWLTM